MRIFEANVGQLARVEALWRSLATHHAELLPVVAGLERRAHADSWRLRRRLYERLLRERTGLVLVAEADGEAVAYAAASIGGPFETWRSGPRVATLETLAVLPAWRARGIGGYLLNEVKTRLSEAGIRELTVSVLAANGDARRFYEERAALEPFLVVMAGQTAANPPTRG